MLKRILVLNLLVSFLFAQPNIPKQLDSVWFNESSSTIFGVMNKTPSTINTFSILKEFKVDWIVKDSTLNPSISLEFAPLWVTVFKGVNYKEYARLPYPIRRLSDMTLSVGNFKSGTNGIAGYAIRYNIFNNHNPAEDKKLMLKIERIYSVREQELIEQITLKEIQKEFGGVGTNGDLAQMEAELKAIQDAESRKIGKMLDEFRSNNWNAAFMNIGWGQTIEYSLPSGDYDTFKPGTNMYCVWLQTGFGLGKIGMVSVLNRWKIDDRLENGINIRMGIEKQNFFIEYINDFILSGDMKHLINFGGSFNIKNKFFANIGLRITVGTGAKFEMFQPIINVNMRL